MLLHLPQWAQDRKENSDVTTRININYIGSWIPQRYQGNNILQIWLPNNEPMKMISKATTNFISNDKHLTPRFIRNEDTNENTRDFILNWATTCHKTRKSNNTSVRAKQDYRDNLLFVFHAHHLSCLKHCHTICAQLFQQVFEPCVELASSARPNTLGMTRNNWWTVRTCPKETTILKKLSITQLSCVVWTHPFPIKISKPYIESILLLLWIERERERERERKVDGVKHSHS